jgi:hypothetical protein
VERARHSARFKIEPSFRSGRVNPHSLASLIGRCKRADLSGTVQCKYINIVTSQGTYPLPSAALCDSRSPTKELPPQARVDALFTGDVFLSAQGAVVIGIASGEI